MTTSTISNRDVAKVLFQIADLLETQEANAFRVNAYRRAARRLQELDEPVAELERKGGVEALRDLADIGRRLAAIITAYLHKGSSRVLQRLQGEVNPEELFAQVPGIGEELAERIVEQLDLHSLGELEQAAHDGRLEQVEGFGKKRVEAVKTSLAGMLSGYAQRSARRRVGKEAPSRESPQPGVDLLLQVDQDYREMAAAGELRTIAPRRFNPDNEAWLPIYHASRREWDFTALFSNTKRAHELDKTGDWVVIYYEKDGAEGQCTVVTATRGDLQGRRVIRGREGECREYYG